MKNLFIRSQNNHEIILEVLVGLRDALLVLPHLRLSPRTEMQQNTQYVLYIYTHIHMYVCIYIYTRIQIHMYIMYIYTYICVTIFEYVYIINMYLFL